MTGHMPQESPKYLRVASHRSAAQVRARLRHLMAGIEDRVAEVHELLDTLMVEERVPVPVPVLAGDPAPLGTSINFNRYLTAYYKQNGWAWLLKRSAQPELSPRVQLALKTIFIRNGWKCWKS